jgi:hypothetical protein
MTSVEPRSPRVELSIEFFIVYCAGGIAQILIDKIIRYEQGQPKRSASHLNEWLP